MIITYNEERNLERCLASIKDIADEIIIVDSFSTDGTVAVARSYNARITEQAFAGYGEQKNFATTLASNDWILSLDADEEVTPALAQSIQQIKRSSGHYAYQMPRLTNYCGKWIKHCGWYPDLQTRLYDRTKGRWEEKSVHEYWRLNDSSGKKGKINGDILHYSFPTINDHLKKIEKYSELAARGAVAGGRSSSLLQIWLSPVWHFFTEYIIRLGFLDGFYGYVICRLSAYAAFIKYAKIRRYSKGA